MHEVEKKILANFQIFGPFGCQGWVVIPQNVKKSQNHCTLLPTPLTHNNTQQHTATVHNSTQVHKTTNVPDVFMALILNGFEECNITTRGIGRGGPRKSRLFWAKMALASLVPFQGPKKS